VANPIFSSACRLCVSVSLWQTPCSQHFAASLSLPKKATPLQSSKSSLFFGNTRGGGLPPATHSGACTLAPPRSITPFGINTCKSATKQKTLSTCRINTYAKPGRGVRGSSLQDPAQPFDPIPSRSPLVHPEPYLRRTTSPPARHSSLATLVYPERCLRRATSPYPFRYPCTRRLLRRARRLATIGRTHRIAFRALPVSLLHRCKQAWRPSTGKNSIVSSAANSS
jgi:hypothetical protein